MYISLFFISISFICVIISMFLYNRKLYFVSNIAFALNFIFYILDLNSRIKNMDYEFINSIYLNMDKFYLLLILCFIVLSILSYMINNRERINTCKSS